MARVLEGNESQSQRAEDDPPPLGKRGQGPVFFLLLLKAGKVHFFSHQIELHVLHQ